MASFYDIYELDTADDHLTALFVATQDQCEGLIEAGIWEEDDLALWQEIQDDHMMMIAGTEVADHNYEVSQWLNQAE